MAYEMASLLTEQDHRVEFVAMIDTFPWSPRSRTITTRLFSMKKDGWLPSQHVQVCSTSQNYSYSIYIIELLSLE